MDVDYGEDVLDSEDDTLETSPDEAEVRTKIERALQLGDSKTVCELIEKNTFQHGADLIEIWDRVHYLQEEKRLGKPLTPLIRFRVRKRYPPPKSICPSGERKTASLPKRATKILKEWLSTHTDDPYPSNKEKEYLSRLSNLTPTQVKTWFANARRRIHRIQDTGARKRSPFHRVLLDDDLVYRRSRRLQTVIGDSCPLPPYNQQSDFSLPKSQTDRGRFPPLSIAALSPETSEGIGRQFHHHNQGVLQDSESRTWMNPTSRLSLNDHHWTMDYYGPDSYAQMINNSDITHPSNHSFLSSSICGQTPSAMMSSMRARRFYKSGSDDGGRRYSQTQAMNTHAFNKRESPSFWNGESNDFDANRRLTMKQLGRVCRNYYLDDTSTFGWTPCSSTIPYQSTSNLMNGNTEPPPLSTRCDPSDLLHSQLAYSGHPFSMMERFPDQSQTRTWNSGRADMDAAKVLADLSSCPH